MPGGEQLPILPVAVLLTAAVLAPIVGLVAPRATWGLAVLGGGVAAVTALAGALRVVAHGPQRYAVGGWPPPWGIEVVLDPLSAFTAAVVTGVTAVTLLTSGPAVLATGDARAPTFYALALLAEGGLVGLVVSGDLFNVFVFLELAAIASYALVASGGGPALAAAFRYLLLGTVGASFYLLGVGLLYAATGTLNMADLAARLADAARPLVAGGAAFVLVGLAIKMALFPLHAWLPEAYTHAPAPVAALLAPVATKAAAYALARVLLEVLRPEAPPVGALLTAAGSAAILVGGLQALRQTDGRRLLAYSSVSQLGYVALGLGLGTPVALVGAYLQVLAHAVAKAALFVAAGAVAARGGGVRVGALDRAMPRTAACAVAAGLSMVGVPPTGGFFAKWYLLQGALEAAQPLVAAVVLGGSLLAAGYVYRFTERLWVGTATPTAGDPEAPACVLAGLVALAVAVVGVGLGNAVIVERLLLPAARGAAGG